MDEIIPARTYSRTPVQVSALPVTEQAESLPHLDASTISVHPLADKVHQRLVNEFSQALLLQAKHLACIRDLDIVSSKHVYEAYDGVLNAPQKSQYHDFLFLLGGTFMGIFGQGFFDELSMEVLRPFWIAVNGVCGIVVSVIAAFKMRR